MDPQLLSALQNVQGLLKVLDFVVKQMLDKQNQIITRLETIEKKLEKQEPAPFKISAAPPDPKKQIIQPTATAQTPEQVADEAKKQFEENVKRRMAEEKTLLQEIAESPKFDEYKEDPIEKFAVEQVIVDEKGKNIYRANVSIHKDGTVIDTVNTATTGKWQAIIPPGKYVIRILKRSADKTYQHEFDFVMPNNAMSLEKLTLKPS